MKSITINSSQRSLRIEAQKRCRESARTTPAHSFASASAMGEVNPFSEVRLTNAIPFVSRCSELTLKRATHVATGRLDSRPGHEPGTRLHGSAVFSGSPF
jgi:hypothetical protein